LEAARAGLIFGTATMVAGFAGPLIGGALGDRLFNRFGPAGRVMLAAGAALTVVPLVACFLLGQPIVLIGALVLSGICIVSALSLSYVTVQAVLPAHSRGLGTGIMSATLALIGSTGPTLVALAAGPGKEATGTLTQAVTAVAASAALLAALIYMVCAILLRRGQQSGTSPA
jgi:MFS family permease